MHGLDKLLLTNEVIFWTSVSVLVFAVGLIVQRRINRAHERAELARAEAEREDLGGNSYFMPLPPAEPAVEISDPVEIDSLLAGESITVAQSARRKLEEPTNINMTEYVPEPPAARRPPPAPAAQSKVAAQSASPILPVPNDRSATAPGGPVRGATQVNNAAQKAPAEETVRIPVRELVLAWFEARGYRAAPVPSMARPIELALAHRKDVDRIYAFVVETRPVNADRAATLLTQARAAGYQRLLIAAQAGHDDGLAELLQPQGIRLFDEVAIRAELDKIDISVAAKIIGVAQGRAQARLAAALAKVPGDKREQPVYTARL